MVDLEAYARLQEAAGRTAVELKQQDAALLAEASSLARVEAAKLVPILTLSKVSVIDYVRAARLLTPGLETVILRLKAMRGQ